jgi:pyruvate ferredoxin oxidoreductase alpha subunit
MTEVIYASVGMRLPFVITGVNRQISAPISIQVDHQDTISLRDSGIIQIYVESSQEAYDAHIAAFRIAEDPGILLPVMVCMDGWILTHSYEPVGFLDQAAVDTFLPPFEPPHYLTCKDPKTWGSYAEENVLMEFKYAVQDAMEFSKGKIQKVFSELAQLTGRDHGGLIETYRTEDADLILMSMGSVSGTIKDAVDRLREDGKRVGLVRIRCYRPFPIEDIWNAIQKAKAVGVMEADYSMGSQGAVAMDLKAGFYGRPGAPQVMDFIAGLGGREVNVRTVGEIVGRMEASVLEGAPVTAPHWVGLVPNLLSEGVPS